MRSAIIFIAAILFSIGLVMIFSTTSAEILDHDLGDRMDLILMKQILYGIIGSALGYLVYRNGFQKWISLSPYLLAVFTLLLVCVLIPGVGKEVNGSRRWIGIAGFTFQPSEFVKYIAPAYVIYYLRSHPNMNFLSFVKLA